MIRPRLVNVLTPRLQRAPLASLSPLVLSRPHRDLHLHSSLPSYPSQHSTCARHRSYSSWTPPSSNDQPNSNNESSHRSKSSDSFWSSWVHSASLQTALTTVVGLGMVFAAGVGYLQWYKHHVLQRMEKAFAGGYDPALEISTLHAPNSSHIHRREQVVIDSIFRGEETGGYYLVIGPKGTGKGTMILDAMREVKAEGASVCEAHPDLEVFRLRLGKALDFDFYEDWQGSLFSRADPRQGGPALDVERAMSKLEKVALRYARRNRRPLVLAISNIHLFPNTPEGHAVLHQLQQRAEAWAEAGIMTMVFTTDDFWCLDKMKKNASRMRILSVYDLSASESINALRHLRRHSLALRQGVKHEAVKMESDEVLRRVYELVGGRTSYLARAARAGDMLEEAEGMVRAEKGWLLSKIGLIPEMDDDVMDEQKWSSCSWLLLRHLARETPTLSPFLPLQPAIPVTVLPDDNTPSAVISTEPIPDPSEQGSLVGDDSPPDGTDDVPSPGVSFGDARRIMTRTDFLEGLDHANIVSIDVHHDVRVDSVLLLRAAQEVVAQEGFDAMLDQTRDRIDEIEGLHRQNELTVKEPFRVLFGRRDGQTVVDVVGLGGSFVPADADDEGEEGSPARLV